MAGGAENSFGTPLNWGAKEGEEGRNDGEVTDALAGEKRGEIDGENARGME